MKILRRWSAAWAVLALMLAGCSAGADAGSGGGNGQVTVFAASSLTDVMERLTHTYAAAHPGTEFQVNYGSSTQLVQQINSGARPDVLVTADERAMAALDSENAPSAEPVVIATNAVVLALAPGNPAGIADVAGVPVDGVTVARCAPTVPCGRATDRVLEASGIVLEGASLENDVRSVLTKVLTGQVDAGFVYTTDVRAARDQGVTAVELKGSVPNRYPAALMPAGAGQAAAEGFYAWLAGPAAAELLTAAGFGAAASTEAGSTEAGSA